MAQNMIVKLILLVSVATSGVFASDYSDIEGARTSHYSKIALLDPLGGIDMSNSYSDAILITLVRPFVPVFRIFYNCTQWLIETKDDESRRNSVQPLNGIR